MPRPSRRDILGDGRCTVHLTIRAHNKQFLFKSAAVKKKLYRLLLRHKQPCKIKLYHYVFMDNHIHLVLYAESTELLSKYMQRVFGALGMYVNKRLGRSGRVFGERAKTPVIQDRKHLFTVMRYIDSNPVRAGMVGKERGYRWSSYRHYAYGERDELVDDAPDYLELAPVAPRRRKMYRELGRRLGFDARLRQPRFTSWYFIGDADWVERMMVERGFLRRRRKKPPG